MQEIKPNWKFRTTYQIGTENTKTVTYIVNIISRLLLVNNKQNKDIWITIYHHSYTGKIELIPLNKEPFCIIKEKLGNMINFRWEVSSDC